MNDGKNSPVVLDGKEASRRVSEAPDTVGFTLLQMMHDFLLSPEELLTELRSGRLVAIGPERRATMRADEFQVTAERLFEWMANPETPPELRARVIDSVKFPVAQRRRPN